MPTTSFVVSVGLDISKDKIDVCCLHQDGSNRSLVSTNTTKGITSMIKSLKKQETAATVPCIIESTGDYHLLSACMIADAGLTVNVINPLITKKYQRSSIRNAKTDSVDAKRLAEIGLLEKGLPIFTFDKERLTIKKFIATIAKLETMIQQLHTHVAGAKRTAKMLGLAIDLRETNKAILCLQKQIDNFRRHITAAAPKEVITMAEETKGLSKDALAIVFGIMGDKSFTNRDQLTAYAGLDVAVRQSGLWHGKQRISKRGNPYLRKVLFQIAWGLKQHNEKFKLYYQSLRLRKKHYLTCLIAIARKFLRFLFAFYWKPRLSTTAI
jgi:transposase